MIENANAITKSQLMDEIIIPNKSTQFLRDLRLHYDEKKFFARSSKKPYRHISIV